MNEIKDNTVLRILKDDGAKNIDFENENYIVAGIAKIIDQNKDLGSWSKRIVKTQNNSYCK